MDTFDNRTRHILIFLMLGGLFFGLGLIFMPVNILTLFGYLQLPDNLQNHDIVSSIFPLIGPWVFGWVALCIYTLKEGTKSALNSNTTFSISYLCVALVILLSGIVGPITNHAIAYLIGNHLYFLLFYVYLFVTNR